MSAAQPGCPAGSVGAMDEQPEPQPPWWEQGEEPDYRATLANERTFLAWTRTALALLAGSLAVLQLVRVAPFGLRLALAGYLIGLAVAVVLVGYREWRVRQQRMRRRQPLGHTAAHALLCLAFLVLAALICAVAVSGPH